MKSQALSKVKDININEEFSADAPSIFVGRFGYPNVNVGFLTPHQKKEDTWLHDAPKAWAKSGFTIPKVIDYRSALINSRFKAKIKGAGAKLYIAVFAFSHDNKGREFSIHFEDADYSYSRKNKAICGTCLKKLGVNELLQENMDRSKHSEKQRENKPKMLKQAQLLLETKQ